MQLLRMLGLNLNQIRGKYNVSSITLLIIGIDDNAVYAFTLSVSIILIHATRPYRKINITNKITILFRLQGITPCLTQ
jgi:hypothetical protein